MWVGTIIRKEKIFEFRYSSNYKKIEPFVPIFPFIDRNRIYLSHSLFEVFSARLPSPRRIDIAEILSKYGLQEYDQFDLLSKSHGILPIDNLEFYSEREISTS